MSKIIKVEVLIASPPTTKCEETIQILDEFVSRYPDNLRLVVFKRGIDFVPDELRMENPNCGEIPLQQEASLQMRTLIRKGSVVPVCVIDGTLFSAYEVPNLVELEKRLSTILKT